MSRVLQPQREPSEIREIVVSYKILHDCIFYDEKQVFPVKGPNGKMIEYGDNIIFLQSQCLQFYQIIINTNNTYDAFSYKL